MIEGVQQVVEVLSIQSIKTPLGDQSGPINLCQHRFNVPHCDLLFGDNGMSHFARMVTPRREKPGRDVGSLATEDLAQVSELPERDLVLDPWDVVKRFSDGGVLDVLIEDLNHFDAQDLPNPPVQKYFEEI